MMSDEEEIDVMGDIYDTPTLNFDSNEVEWPDIGVEKISGSDLLDDYAYPSIITHCDSTSDLNDLTSLPATINENSSDTQSATSSIEEDFWTEGEKMQLEKGLSVCGPSWVHLQLWVKTKTARQIKNFVNSQNYQSSSSGQNFLNNPLSDDLLIDQSQLVFDGQIPAMLEVVVEDMPLSPVLPNKSFKKYSKTRKHKQNAKIARKMTKKPKVSSATIKSKARDTPKKKIIKTKKQNIKPTIHHSPRMFSNGEEVIVIQKETEDSEDVEISVDDKASDISLAKKKTKVRIKKNVNKHTKDSSAVTLAKDIKSSQSTDKNQNCLLNINIKEENPTTDGEPSVKLNNINLKKIDFGVPLAIIKDGGYTISHNADGSPSQTMFIENPQKRLRSKQTIALLKCSTFKGKKPAPFKVDLSMEAVVIMDIHAHSSIVEAGGLLGGHYDTSSKTLFIKMASPCQSESTKVQCDLCPVAMMEAMEEFQRLELNVVGWYHSHPTFLPNPSLQDIATQKDMQNWFEDTAGCPVISFIISPFCSLNRSLQSRYRCLIILSENSNERIPYEIKPHISSESLKKGFVMNISEKLLNIASKNKQLITDFDQDHRQQGITKLNKCVESCRLHMISCNPPVPENLTKDILQEVVEACNAYKGMKYSGNQLESQK